MQRKPPNHLGQERVGLATTSPLSEHVIAECGQLQLPFTATSVLGDKAQLSK